MNLKFFCNTRIFSKIRKQRITKIWFPVYLQKSSFANNFAKEPTQMMKKKIFSLRGYFLGGGTISPSTTSPSITKFVVVLSIFIVLWLLLYLELFEESWTLCKVAASSGDITSSASLQDCNVIIVKTTAEIIDNFFIRFIFTNVSPKEDIKQV